MARAWQARELGLPWEVMEVAEVEVPEPGPGQIRIRVEAADVNFADILQCQGQYQVRLDPPFTPGNKMNNVVAVRRSAISITSTPFVSDFATQAGTKLDRKSSRTEYYLCQ